MATRVSHRKASTASFASSNGNGNSNKPAVANKILLGLPRKEYKAVFPKLEWVDLPVHTVLNQVAKPIEYGYFMNSGLASVLIVLAGGKVWKWDSPARKVLWGCRWWRDSRAALRGWSCRLGEARSESARKI